VQPAVSYTQMWEDSLRYRFELTNFVPLVGGCELRGGELRILMPLSCGGLSSVYLARDRRGRRFVLKELAVPAGQDNYSQKLHEMLAREASILAKLDYPTIVKVMDCFVENGRDYLVLEFVPGLTLRQLVQMRGALAEREVISMGKQIAEILRYLHGFEPPIIHRDLTPDNLIVRAGDGRIVLIDFGAASEFIGSLTGTLIGKQSYMPPEQFRGQAVPASDIYAAGATLHFLLTAADPEPITPAHPRESREDVSSVLDEIIAAAMALDVRDRLQSAGELRGRLDSLFVETEPGG
jgi:serine/threonine protein kinase